jgi:hypothetical protein
MAHAIAAAWTERHVQLPAQKARLTHPTGLAA